MNFVEGYRRLAIVVSCLAGPLWLLLVLAAHDWRSPGTDGWLVVILAATGVSAGAWFFLWLTWLGLWLGRKVALWVAAGFISKQPKD